MAEGALAGAGEEEEGGSNAEAAQQALRVPHQGELPSARRRVDGTEGCGRAARGFCRVILNNVVTCSVSRKPSHGRAFPNCWQEQTRSSEPTLPARCQRTNACPSEEAERSSGLPPCAPKPKITASNAAALPPSFFFPSVNIK